MTTKLCEIMCHGIQQLPVSAQCQHKYLRNGIVTTQSMVIVEYRFSSKIKYHCKEKLHIILNINRA